jgi:hypothetical protein
MRCQGKFDRGGRRLRGQGLQKFEEALAQAFKTGGGNGWREKTGLMHLGENADPVLPSA